MQVDFSFTNSRWHFSHAFHSSQLEFFSKNRSLKAELRRTHHISTMTTERQKSNALKIIKGNNLIFVTHVLAHEIETVRHCQWALCSRTSLNVHVDVACECNLFVLFSEILITLFRHCYRVPYNLFASISVAFKESPMDFKMLWIMEKYSFSTKMLGEFPFWWCFLFGWVPSIERWK